MSNGEPIFVEDGAAERFMVWPDGTALRLEFNDANDLDFSRRLGKGTRSEFAEIAPHDDGRVELMRVVPCGDCEGVEVDFWHPNACEECGGYGVVLDYAKELVDVRAFVSTGEAA